MKVKTPLFKELRGSMGKPLAYDRPTCRTLGTGRIILMKKPTPRYTRTAGQDEVRNKFTAAKEAWNALTPEEKASYNTEAAPLLITGYNLFLREYITGGTWGLFEFYNTGLTGFYGAYADHWLAQTFTVGASGPNVSHFVQQCDFYMTRWESPGDIVLSIRNVDGEGKPTGNDLTSGTMNGNAVPYYPDYKLFECYIEELILEPSTKYAMVLRAPNGTVYKIFYVGNRSATSNYPGGQLFTSANRGSSWSPVGSADLLFNEWGRRVV